MPILVMALLALAVFGVIGILLTVAVVLEHRTVTHAAEKDAAHPVTADATLSPNPTFHTPRGEDAPTPDKSEKEKVHEHACTG
jgi:hypothetical protein